MGALALLYGILVYAFFLATSLYAVGFVGNLVVPKTIDTGVTGPLAEALLVDLALLAVFAVQHSVMARRSFKQTWTRIVPPSVERSTYVLAASLALALLLWQWRPITQPVVWSVEHPVAVFVLRALFWLGWGVMVLSSFLISHLEMLGLRQVYARFTNRPIPEGEFRTPLLYKHVRHPIYLGFILAFWAAPVMTAGHLLFAIGMTAYIFAGIWFEERDLIAHFGERYRAYREEAGMLLPRVITRKGTSRSTTKPIRS